MKHLQLQKLAKGVKPGINRNDVYSISVYLPPLQEQKRIVTILDEVFTAIDKAKANAEKNLANAKELFESCLNGIFANPGEDWEEKTLCKICTIKHGFAFEGKFFFNTVDIRNKIESSASGVKVRHTSPKKIGDINVWIPMSLSVQQDIVHKINVLKKETKQLESIYQQKIADLEELKKSILKKAFQGEL